MNNIAKISMALITATLLSACEGGLKGGPDEFSVIPTKPLETPENYDTLPEPYAATRNLADLFPKGDGVEALGGSVAVLESDKIRSSEQDILTATSRYGRPTNIRETVAAEDEAFRERNKGRILERLFDVDVDLRRYKDQILPPYEELERLRKRGIRTPTVAPSN